MIKFVLAFLVLFAVVPVNAQIVKPVNDQKLSIVLNNIVEVKNYSNNELQVNVVRLRIPIDLIPGSESHEIYDKIYIGLSESGEAPLYKTFEISKLVNATNIKINPLNNYKVEVTFDSGVFNKRHKSIFRLDVQNLSLTKIK